MRFEQLRRSVLAKRTSTSRVQSKYLVRKGKSKTRIDLTVAPSQRTKHHSIIGIFTFNASRIRPGNGMGGYFNRKGGPEKRRVEVIRHSRVPGFFCERAIGHAVARRFQEVRSTPLGI